MTTKTNPVNVRHAETLAQYAKTYPAQKAAFDTQLCEFPLGARAGIRKAAIKNDTQEVRRLALKSLR